MGIDTRKMNKQQFNKDLFNLLKHFEGQSRTVMSDTEGIPTIGHGYALIIKNKDGTYKVRDNLKQDLAQLSNGITDKEEVKKLTLSTESEEKLREITLDLNKLVKDTKLTEKEITTRKKEIIDKVNAYKFGLDLKMENQDKLLSNIQGRYVKGALDTLEKNGISRDKYENSKELVTLSSLYYNNPSLIGPGLIGALKSGNRASAFNEITYNSNAGYDKGIGKRRFIEGAEFGLTNKVMSNTDVVDFISMLMKNHEKITEYEKNVNPFDKNYLQDYFKTGHLLEIGDLFTNYLKFLTQLEVQKRSGTFKQEESPIMLFFNLISGIKFDNIKNLGGGGGGWGTTGIFEPNPIICWAETVWGLAFSYHDPLTFDLDGDGIETVSLNNSATYFDLDADGFRERTGWISKDDGVIIIDANNNGIVDDINELFGNTTINGMEELKTYDSNLDGKIDSGDAEFSKMKIWQDLNEDGISQQGEMKTLSELNISSIDLNYDDVYQINNGNIIYFFNNQKLAA